jgi:non-specific serine/threonine protein kinase
MPNIRQALTFSIDNHPQTALQISAGLRPLWVTGFTLNEARRWLDLALTASSGEPSAERVEALCSAAELAVMCGDEAGARSAVQEATTIRFDSVNARLRGIEYFIALFDNDIARAQECLHDAMEASPDAPEVRTACLCNMGFALVHAGDFTQAHACFDEALKLTHSHEESVWRAKALVCCGLVNIMRDEPRRAQDDLVRGLVLAQRTDDRYCVAQSLVMLGWIATSAGDARRGAELMAAASTVSRTAGAELIGSPELQRWHDDFIQQARNQLGKRAFDNAWRWGSSHTCAEAIDMALGQGRGVPAATTERIDDNTAAPTEWG